MEIKTIIESLRHCTISEGECRSCPSYHHDSGCLDRLHAKAAVALESQQQRIAELEAQNRWIPVTERLPEREGRYLCVKRIRKPGSVYVQIMNGDGYGFSMEHIYTDDVTHWMPLPEPPKEVV